MQARLGRVQGFYYGRCCARLGQVVAGRCSRMGVLLTVFPGQDCRLLDVSYCQQGCKDGRQETAAFVVLLLLLPCLAGGGCTLSHLIVDLSTQDSAAYTLAAMESSKRSLDCACYSLLQQEKASSLIQAKFYWEDYLGD
jgi:hypothetical protein